MCGRYTLTNQGDVVRALAVATDRASGHADFRPRYNLAPTQAAPVVVLRDGARTLELMRWGLVPRWAAAPGSKAPLMINARVETAAEKSVYRDALARRRCLVPADGFLEWARGAGAKRSPQPTWFHPADGGVIAFAGLYARAGELASFTILTGAAAPLVAPIHDRMPLVVPPAAYAAWLDPDLDAEAARAIVSAPTLDAWLASPVSTRVNAATHDDPECLAPPPQAQLW